MNGLRKHIGLFKWEANCLEDPPDFQGGQAAFLQTLQEEGLREKSTSYLLHVSKERARDETPCQAPQSAIRPL